MIEAATLKAAWVIVRRYWWTIPIAVLSLYAWRLDRLRASYKADLTNVRAEYALFRKDVTLRSGEALAAQKAVNAAQEQTWKDKADAADESIDDLRARLRTALLRGSGSGGSPGSGTGATAEAGDPGVPAGVPASAGSAAGSMSVDPDILAGLAAYGIQCHRWAVSLSSVTPERTSD